MTTIEQIHQKLEKQCPPDYQINEIIRFAYPYRELKIKVTVNKSPEESLQQVYTSFLKTIKAGFSKEADFRQFLGLGKDDFILKELYFLREKGFVDLVSDAWQITEQGKEYIKDNSILQVLKEEEFHFFIDGLTDRVTSLTSPNEGKNTEKQCPFEIQYPNRSPQILQNRHEQLADSYKVKNPQQSLIDYNKDSIFFDKERWNDYYLIEYKPIKTKQDTIESYIEIRNTNKDYSLNKRLSEILANRYEDIIYGFSDSERTSFAKIIDEKALLSEFSQTHKRNISTEKEIQELSIWQTQAKFEEALKTVKKRLLIESPWIKRATLQYIPSIERTLTRGVKILILYGIEGNDNHHYGTMEELRKLNTKFPELLHLVHLPSHFKGIRTSMTGTHRKLLIKDNDYYISGSFNFLSFNRKEGQTIANEESTLIRRSVNEKWKRVFEEYHL